MVEIITLTCPSCGATARAKENNDRFQCEYCGNILQIHETNTPALPSQKPLSIKLPVPNEVRMERDSRGSLITWRWFSWKYIPLLLFCIFWDGFLIFWFGMAFGMNAPLVFKLFPIIHVAVGVYVTYSTLAGFINRTNIELTPTELVVWFEPLPWPGEKKFKTINIRQIYCREKIIHHKNSTSQKYNLMLVTRENTQVELLRGLDSPDLALFLEQQLEEWMGIQDELIRGEYGK